VTAPSTPGAGHNARPVTDLREWLDRLAETGRLAVAQPGVALRFGVAALAKCLDGTKATLFPRPDGHAVAVVSGLVSSRAWIAEAMGVGEDAMLQRFEAATLAPIAPREVAHAPVQEVIHRSVDLTRLLPIPTTNEHDSGPYISAGLVIARNPATGAQNVSINRLQVNGPDRLGVLLLPRHTHHFYTLAQERGEALEVAIVIGVDPLTLLASQAIVPLDCDELGIAGALHGAPLEVVRCITKDLLVPAAAEIVIEGRILPDVREPEGPFGEFPQTYAERAPHHVVAVDAVTLRKDALFHTINGGGLEHLMLGAIPREATLLAHLRRSFPGILDAHLPRGGVCRYHLVVKLRQRHAGEAKNVILGAFAGHYDLKQVIVVDEDVDIHDPAEVEWAVATRFQADRDLVMVTGAQGSRLDPSARAGVGAKMGLDATKPVDAPEMHFKRIRVPGEETIDLAVALSPLAPSAWRSALAGGPR
jgi:2,5-furandicarboxylate decarboxylase 1